MLLEELDRAQSGDDQAMLNLISKFLPLIKKYERRLGYEDAANDLTADFIEFISKWNLNNFHQSSDGAVVKYIAQSLYHIYLERLKFQIEIEPKCISMEELTPAQLNELSAKTATWDKYTLSTVIPNGLLTPREFFILSEIYERGTPVASLAKSLRVSRQNVNQIKKKAVAKLKRQFGETP